MATIMTVTLNPAVDRTLEVRNFQPGKVYKGTLLAFRAAGKGVNVSAVLAALGRPSVALGFVGQHEQSFFRSSLHPALVDCRLAPISAVTRHNTTIIDPARRTETHLREQGFAVNETLLRELKRSIGTVLRGGDVCVFAGSLPRGVDGRRFVDLVRFCAQVGARVVVDGEGEILEAVAGVGGAGAPSRAPGPRLELIKPNVAELGQLAGRRLRTVPQVVSAARSCLTRRLGTMLVSWGERGAYLVSADAAWHARAAVPPDRFANSVGAGDALLAGFVAGLSDAQPAEACLRLAVACAAAECVTYAAGEVEPETVAAFARNAVVERIDEAALAPGAGARGGPRRGKK